MRLSGAYDRLRWQALSGWIALGIAVHVRADEAVLAMHVPPKVEVEAEARVIPACKTDLRLSGAVYDSERPERSFALVHAVRNQPATVARVGARVGAFEVVAIEPRGVLLRDAQGACWLPLIGDPTVRAQRAAAPAPRRQSKKDSKSVVVGRR